jgi:hypothetical protein
MQGMAANLAWLVIKWQSWLICSRAVKTPEHVKLFRGFPRGDGIMTRKQLVTRTEIAKMAG